MKYPFFRSRRLRRTEALRRMVRETRLSIDNLIMPCFVTSGRGIKQPLPSLPGIQRFSPDNLIKEIKGYHSLGIAAVLLFGVPLKKDEKGSLSYNEKGPVPEAVKIIKKEIPELAVITDVCLCSYTSHGHCGVIKDGRVDNDPTLELLARTALAHARAGADVVAPSAMMDGQVKAIREALDSHNFKDTAIMSYAAKYASSFYGPFREAAKSAPQFGHRQSYQMDPANGEEALREIKADMEEGADIVMVKPAWAYLDIIQAARQNFNIPLAAYNVSGEYSLVKAGASRGLFKEKEVILEILTAIKRAGADLIITYHAKEAAEWLKD